MFKRVSSIVCFCLFSYILPSLSANSPSFGLFVLEPFEGEGLVPAPLIRDGGGRALGDLLLNVEEQEELTALIEDIGTEEDWRLIRAVHQQQIQERQRAREDAERLLPLASSPIPIPPPYWGEESREGANDSEVSFSERGAPGRLLWVGSPYLLFSLEDQERPIFAASYSLFHVLFGPNIAYLGLLDLAYFFHLRGERNFAFYYLDVARRVGFDFEAYLSELENARWVEEYRETRRRPTPPLISFPPGIDIMTFDLPSREEEGAFLLLSISHLVEFLETRPDSFNTLIDMLAHNGEIYENFAGNISFDSLLEQPPVRDAIASLPSLSTIEGSPLFNSWLFADPRLSRESQRLNVLLASRFYEAGLYLPALYYFLHVQRELLDADLFFQCAESAFLMGYPAIALNAILSCHALISVQSIERGDDEDIYKQYLYVPCVLLELSQHYMPINENLSLYLVVLLFNYISYNEASNLASQRYLRLRNNHRTYLETRYASSSLQEISDSEESYVEGSDEEEYMEESDSSEENHIPSLHGISDLEESYVEESDEEEYMEGSD